MEFLLGFLVGGACVVMLLVQWGRRHAASSSAQPSASPKDTTHQSYEGVIADFEAESNQLLRELQQTFATYSRKGK
jgi:hypothetical protein